MIDFVTALCVLGIAAPFVLYPIGLLVRAHLRPRPWVNPADDDTLPHVTLIVCAHDEAASIGAKLGNLLALDYPAERLDIVIASDGSRDATVAIAQRLARQDARADGAPAPRVRVLDLPRKGKAHAIEIAASTSEADILAFSDANSMWRPDALRALVRPFGDPQVGGVAGDQRYTDPDARDAADGERLYWNLDRHWKQWQSRAGNAVSATGAIYAVRRDCFEPPPPDATDDFMISTGVIVRGRRLVFALDAVAVEPPAAKHAQEFRRKVRVITRGLRGVGYRRELLHPAHYGVYAIDLFLHKLWRRLVFLPAGGLLLVAPFAVQDGGPSAWIALAVIAVFLAGGLGILLPARHRIAPLSICGYVLLVNAACAVAVFDTLRGQRVAHWEPERTSDELRESAP